MSTITNGRRSSRAVQGSIMPDPYVHTGRVSKHQGNRSTRRSQSRPSRGQRDTGRRRTRQLASLLDPRTSLLSSDFDLFAMEDQTKIVTQRMLALTAVMEATLAEIKPPLLKGYASNCIRGTRLRAQDMTSAYISSGISNLDQVLATFKTSSFQQSLLQRLRERYVSAMTPCSNESYTELLLAIENEEAYLESLWERHKTAEDWANFEASYRNQPKE